MKENIHPQSQSQFFFKPFISFINLFRFQTLFAIIFFSSFTSENSIKNESQNINNEKNNFSAKWYFFNENHNENNLNYSYEIQKNRFRDCFMDLLLKKCSKELNLVFGLKTDLINEIRFEAKTTKNVFLSHVQNLANEINSYRNAYTFIRDQFICNNAIKQFDLQEFDLFISLFKDELSSEKMTFVNFIGNMSRQFSEILQNEIVICKYHAGGCIVKFSEELNFYKNLLEKVRNISITNSQFYQHGIELSKSFYSLFCNELSAEMSSSVILLRKVPHKAELFLNNKLVNLKSTVFSFYDSKNQFFDIQNINMVKTWCFGNLQKLLVNLQLTENKIKNEFISFKKNDISGNNKNFSAIVNSIYRDDSITEKLNVSEFENPMLFYFENADMASARTEIVLYPFQVKEDKSFLKNYLSFSVYENIARAKPLAGNSDKETNELIKYENRNFLLCDAKNTDNQINNIKTPLPVFQNELTKNVYNAVSQINNDRSSLLHFKVHEKQAGLMFTGNSNILTEGVLFNVEKVEEEKLNSDIINLNLPDLNLCNIIDTVLDAGNPNSEYLWSTGEKTQKIRVNRSGVYYVTVSRGSNKAVDSSCVRINSLPKVNLPDYTVICHGDDICLNAGGGNYNYNWSNGATTTSIFVYEKGTYYVDVSNECGAIRDYSTVLISDSCNNSTYKIPEFFTPNGDGDDDSFKFYVKDIISAKTTIYSLSGIKIYENYGTEEYWNGLIGDKKAADGSYYYIIYAKKKSSDIEFRGRIRLKR